MSDKTLISISSALLLASAYIFVSTAPAQAASGCALNLDSADMMKFSVTEISVPKTCKDFTINLKHIGKMPKNIMGHNLVISKEADQAGVIEDGNKAGIAGDYVKAKDARVVAYTKIIGGGEAASTKFAVAKLNTTDKFTFYCSFPGHAFGMKGAVKLV